MKRFNPDNVRKDFRITNIERKKKAPGPKPSPVQRMRVHPGIWEQALKVAQFDAHRIEVRSPTDVVVHPTRNWRVQARVARRKSRVV